MARPKTNTDSDWDDHVIESHKNIPGDIYSIVAMATELIKTSIQDAANFASNNLDSIDAVDWLFYSKDNQPWSFGWVIEMLGDIRQETINIAACRLMLLKNPSLLTAKQEFDLMVYEGLVKNRQPLRTQMKLLTGT